MLRSLRAIAVPAVPTLTRLRKSRPEESDGECLAAKRTLEAEGRIHVSETSTFLEPWAV